MSGAFPWSRNGLDGLEFSNDVFDPGKATGNRVSSHKSTAFGLKKPINVFWPVSEIEEGVHAADLGRFVNVLDRGWKRLRETVWWVLFLSMIGAEEFLIESLDPKFVRIVIDSLASVGGVLAGVAASTAGSNGMLADLRANMSLMLLRLSISNSGSKRPDAGNVHSFKDST